MKLYYSPGACSLASHIVLKELGLPFELVMVKRGEPPAGYEKIRPLGGVPTLVTDEGKVFTEGAAILQYLADRKPAAGLAPAPASSERYDLQETLNFLSTEIHKGFSPIFALPRLPLDDKSKADLKEFYLGNLAKRFDVLESRLQKSQYLVGNKFGVADAYLFTILGWSKNVGVSLDKWPAILAHSQRVRERGAVREAMQAEGLA